MATTSFLVLQDIPEATRELCYQKTASSRNENSLTVGVASFTLSGTIAAILSGCIPCAICQRYSIKWR